MTERPQAPEAALFKARVDVVTLDGEPISWDFPVLSTTDRERVDFEIRERLAANAGLDQDQIRVTYPAGPWNEPLDRDLQIIGSGPDRRPRSQPAAPPQQPPQAPRRPQPQGLWPPHLGAMPNQSQDRLAAAAAELAFQLFQWAEKYRLSSSEYYFQMARALEAHAGQLVLAERATQPRRPS